MRAFFRKLAGRVVQRAREFVGAKDGNVAIIVGLSIIPMFVAAGAGLDAARAMIVRTNLTSALDAAGLAVGSSTGLTQTQMQTLAQQYFDANYKVDTAYGTPAPVSVVVSQGTATVSTSVAMPTVLMDVVGINSINVNATSEIVWGQTKLWVSLVLDNTGSMTQTDSTGTSKISALKTATTQLLTMLQNASANPGDVQVALIPFSKTVNVGTGNVNASWIDWTNWDSAPPGGAPSSSVGPGSACPWSTGTNGFRCTTGPTNGSSNTSTIPSSGTYKGYICPSVNSSNASTGQGGHYYNGCYNSVPTQTLTTTTTTTTPITIKQTCSQTGSGPITCTNNNGYPKSGSSTSNTTTATTPGYTGDSGPTTTTNTTTDSTTDGSKTCNGSGKCTWTRTILQTQTGTTVTATGAAPYNHTWIANDHSTWDGCIMDRDKDNDVSNTTPSGSGTLFPAENAQSCVPSVMLGTMGYDWTALNNAVNAMTAGGSTNQTIGLAWGWQAQTGGDPLNAPALPSNTAQYIILVSDGLNTQDRFSGDGSNQDSGTDARMALACTNAKAAGFIIYTVFVDLNGTQGNSTVLQNCATDSSKYFDLTTSGAIITTLNQIGQQITNLRVAL